MNEPDWDVLDAVYFALTETPQNPSTIARKAKVTYAQAQAALRSLVAGNNAVAVGNGCWTNYRLRRWGEFNKENQS